MNKQRTSYLLKLLQEKNETFSLWMKNTLKLRFIKMLSFMSLFHQQNTWDIIYTNLLFKSYGKCRFRMAWSSGGYPNQGLQTGPLLLQTGLHVLALNHLLSGQQMTVHGAGMPPGSREEPLENQIKSLENEPDVAS